LLEDDWARVSVPAIAGPYAQTYLDKFDSFVQESDQYADDMTVNNWSASAYDAITVTALAIERAGEVSPEAIERNLGPVTRNPGPGTEVSTFAEGKEALDNGDEISYVGAQTAVRFNDTGDVFNAARIWDLEPDAWSERDLIAAARIRNVVRTVTEQAQTTPTPTATTDTSG
jgi:ABC-type branched-subunit amino acid transport system substrate-binding protein